MPGLCRSYVQRRALPHVGTSYTPAQIAALYGAPTGVVPTSPQPIALIELGGGYSPAAIAQQFVQWGLPAPQITDIGVDGAVNSYTGDPNSADVEVELDICCAAGLWSYCTGTPAQLLLIFAPNTNQGFLDAIVAATKAGASTIGISWGAPENQWGAPAIQAMDAVLLAAAAAGVTTCCASGDSGSSDGERGNNMDYPGSSPYVVDCGGTTILVSGGVITNEVPWNSTVGATGGGFSAIEPVPSWQVGFVQASKNRGGPDLVADADPATGWATPFGPVGGTSAVAPFLAGFFAVANAARTSRLGLVNAVLYASEATAFRDLVAGNNGQFSATKGWDPASGLGAPLLTQLFAILTGAVVPLPPPPPPPPPLPMERMTVSHAVRAGRHLLWPEMVLLQLSTDLPAGTYTVTK